MQWQVFYIQFQVQGPRKKNQAQGSSKRYEAKIFQERIFKIQFNVPLLCFAKQNNQKYAYPER